MDPTQTYSPADANKRSGIGLRTIYNAIHSGALPAIRLGEKRIRIRPESFETWLKSLETGGQQ
jgi:excisionase family DNA binding protein